MPELQNMQNLGAMPPISTVRGELALPRPQGTAPFDKLRANGVPGAILSKTLYVRET
jgi:hypothetical protein